LAFFGFGIVGLKSSDIGFSTPIIVPKKETLAVNKDLLLPSCSSKEGGQQITCFCYNRFGTRGKINKNQEKKCMNLKFVGGFSRAIRDGVQED